MTISTLLHWLKINLFDSWLNVILTVLSVVFLLFTGIPFVRWALFGADWTPITENVRLFLVGQYPVAQMWRPGVIFVMLLCLFAWSWQKWICNRAYGRTRWLLCGWCIFFVFSWLLASGIPGSTFLPVVELSKWSGLFLTFTLAVGGIVLCFPLGLMLALMRRSHLPVLKWCSIAFIETIRGVPLVTLLFIASVLISLFLPPGVRFDRVLRALVVIALFSSAYMAENIRGGLQSIPKTQVEAAQALGFGPIRTLFLIVLPQALRNVIPVIAGQFIALFKDTTLVVVIGLLEIVGIGKSIILGNVEWVSLQAEVYVFLAFVFWICTYTMSHTSRRLETALGVGMR